MFRAHRRRVVAPASWDAEVMIPSGFIKTAATQASNSNKLVTLHNQRLDVLERQGLGLRPLCASAYHYGN